MTLDDAEIRELVQAFDALELVIAARLEERRGGRGPGGLLGRPTPAPGAGLPGTEVYAGSGPLAQVVRAGELDPAEALLLTAALARQADDRFDPLFAALSERPATTGLTGEVARTLVARTAPDRLRFPARLAPDAPLVAAGLVELAPGDPRLAGELRATEDFAQWALGLPTSVGGPGAGMPATRIHTVHSLDDVVLPLHQRLQLVGLVDRIRDRRLVVDTWGFGRHHDSVSGLVALFHGPSGTGKSMAAAAIGRAAGLPVWRVDLARIVSKYVGETSKLLSTVFDRAAREGWLLLFDEADAVFGRRTEVSDAHDRYANQDVSYLLTRLSDHPGTVVLTTNLLANIDDAFQRRLHVVVEFEEPGYDERRQLWAKAVPQELPLSEDVDWHELARTYQLTGAQIRDATLDAAFAAAANGQVVTGEHLEAGIRGQFAKSGRSAPAAGR